MTENWGKIEQEIDHINKHMIGIRLVFELQTIINVMVLDLKHLGRKEEEEGREGGSNL